MKDLEKREKEPEKDMLTIIAFKEKNEREWNTCRETNLQGWFRLTFDNLRLRLRGAKNTRFFSSNFVPYEVDFSELGPF